MFILNKNNKKFLASGILLILLILTILSLNKNNQVKAQNSTPTVTKKLIQKKNPTLLRTSTDKNLFSNQFINPNVKTPSTAKKGHIKQVNFNSDYYNMEQFDIDLFDRPITVLKSRISERFGAKSWIGKIENEDGSQIVLTERNGIHYGVITSHSGLFEIAQNENGNYNLFEVDLQKLPASGCNTIQVAADKVDNNIQLDNFSQESQINSETASDANGNVIDIMLAYTKSFRVAAGGKNEAEIRMVNAVVEANQAYLESGVNLSWNLVHIYETEYDDSDKSFGTILSDFSSDAYTKNLRNEYGADVVSLIVNNSQNCGLGYISSGFTDVGQNSAYSVVYGNCLSYKSLTHEVGHNQGCRHDRAVEGGGSPNDFGYGYKVCKSIQNGGFRTILAYGCDGVNTPRVNRISSPDYKFNGQIQGIDFEADPANSSDNARKMNSTGANVVAYRESKSLSKPTRPENLSVKRISDNILRVNWKDVSDNEDAFSIQRSRNKVNWQTIADLSANRISFSDFIETISGTYYYRIRSKNSKGVSNWSNIATYKNSPPNISLAYATPRTIKLDKSTTLISQASDNDQVTLKYNWTKLIGPGRISFSSSSSARSQASFTVPGKYDIEVTVSDGLLSNSKIVTVIVESVKIVSESGSFITEQINRDTWHAVNLSKSYQNPVIIFSPLTKNGYQPAHIRVKNVRSNSFEWQIEEWDYLDGYHMAEKIDYIVLEAGTYLLSNSRKLVAGNVVSTDQFVSRAFPQKFAKTPVVVCQLVSAQDKRPGTVRLNSISNQSFDIKIQSEEAKGKKHGDEIVSYLAVENATFTDSGILESGVTNTSVDHNWFEIQFKQVYPNTPSLFASFQTTNGNDTSDLRIKGLKNNKVEVQVHEEQSKDQETYHVKESVGYILFDLE